MGRIVKTDRSLNIRINRLFKYSLHFSLVIGFFVPVSAFWGNTALSNPFFPNPEFSIATMDRRIDFPVQWVTAGGGVLAYGAGQHVDFALEGDPLATVSHLTFDGVISEALVLGKYAFLSQEGSGLRLIDLEVPSSPLDMGVYPLSGSSFRLAMWGNLLFVGGTDFGIRIFELSHDRQTSQAHRRVNLMDRGWIPVETPISAMTASQWKLYVAGGGEGIRVFDLSNPLSIVEEENLPVNLPIRSMAGNGNHLYVGAGPEGLHVIDLSRPGEALTVAIYPVASESLYQAGRLIYLASGAGGLQLLKTGPVAAATQNVTISDFAFTPASVTLNPGDTVLWTWTGIFAHTTTSGTLLLTPRAGPYQRW